MHTEAAPAPSPLYRSEAFAEDLEPEDTPPQPPAGMLPMLLALLPAVVALASGAAAVVARAS